MTQRFLDTETVIRMLGLVKDKALPPPEITKLKEEISGRIRAAELKYSVSGEIDKEEIRAIVKMRRELDGLYALWAEGKL